MPEQTLSIDAASTTVNFEIVALWFLKRRGEFTEIEGTLKILDDGKRAQIDVRIAVASVQMKDPEHVELLLSPAFFDAVGHPLDLRIRKGYDHSYYFISSYISEHFIFHMRRLNLAR